MLKVKTQIYFTMPNDTTIKLKAPGLCPLGRNYLLN